jgi:hypothetical protein
VLTKKAVIADAMEMISPDGKAARIPPVIAAGDASQRGI